jgi:hypothetical protein
MRTKHNNIIFWFLTNNNNHNSGGQSMPNVPDIVPMIVPTPQVDEPSALLIIPSFVKVAPVLLLIVPPVLL